MTAFRSRPIAATRHPKRLRNTTSRFWTHWACRMACSSIDLRVTPPPAAAQLLKKFKDWSDSDEVVERILVTNPTELYN